MLRLIKVVQILRSVADMISSEATGIIANIVTMVLCMLLLSHFVACGWYFLSHWESERTDDAIPTWITVHNMKDKEIAYQYFTGFHWAMTQFTPASMDVQPHNLAERVYAVSVVIMALVVFSYVLGSITGSLQQLRGMQQEASKLFWKMRRFL